ncbi:ALBINO3-like protein 2, chloroplastic [Silene latifolia]|uniref:ALBINO3-like protein 2, chloroplastic n=1 Tax=Silene latifolia TaxID=37657 RepID=UPI003D7871C3
MATTRLISTYLRRRSPFSLLRSLSSSSPTSDIYAHTITSPSSSTTSFRFFSSNSPDSVFNHELSSVTESELRNLGFTDGFDSVSSGLVEDSVFPIRAVVSLLDGFHEFTDLPWWIVIASSTVALRVTLLPLIILQLKKLQQIGELIPKLPPPLPPPFSGKSYRDQLSVFRRERKALGCPSFLWFIASHTVQIPCFILWMVSIRRMSLDEFPGFDTGGILWFQDLTVSSTGFLGSVFPLLIAGLHLSNVQFAFRGSSANKGGGVLQLLGEWYRKYLQLLTLPILLATFHVPQGSLVYWVTNSLVTLVQHACLRDPAIRHKLGLATKEALHLSAKSENDVNVIADAPSKKGPKSAFDLSPLELVHLSVSYLSSGKTEKALILLRLAVEKDPDCYRAWTLLGDIMMEKGLWNEAAEYSECAISKISLLEEPCNADATDFLIQASVAAGGALYRQGKVAEALVHFEKVRDMKEPEDSAAKARYYAGLVVYASALLNQGRKDEAVHYLRLAIAFDPQHSAYLKILNLEKDTDDFAGDLTSSRRSDY